jgi:guanylate kinase
MNRIVLCGKAASGKDHMRKTLQSRGFTYGVSYTTRPPRQSEVCGIDYHFISVPEFEALLADGYWYEWVEFNGWHYATSNEQFLKDCNLFIMTPKGISLIKPQDRLTTTVMWLDVDLETRQQRLSLRKMPGDTADRRIQADESDFAGFTDYDVRITNSNF